MNFQLLFYNRDFLNWTTRYYNYESLKIQGIEVCAQRPGFNYAWIKRKLDGFGLRVGFARELLSSPKLLLFTPPLDLKKKYSQNILLTEIDFCCVKKVQKKKYTIKIFFCILYTTQTYFHNFLHLLLHNKIVFLFPPKKKKEWVFIVYSLRT